tara:strand:- start:51 stop:254 length:204 start_codon:yes stop_codon:yes gene_type:complete
MSDKPKIKKYTFTGSKTFWQNYKITIESNSEDEAKNIAYSFKYNSNNEWNKVGNLEPDDKIIDIELD